MYVTVQFIILEILLGLIFLVVLYFMLRELLKKIIRKELREIKEPLQVLANYLVEQSQQQDPDGPDGGSGNSNEAERQSEANGSLPATSPEKLPELPVDIANEFVQLKNTNRITAYNIRVQKIWDLYKQTKITLVQYKEELYRLKKEFGIATSQEDHEAHLNLEKSTKEIKIKPLTPMPKGKEQADEVSNNGHENKQNKKQNDSDKGNKAASIEDH